MYTQNPYFLIHWRSPKEKIPEEASYILIRQDFGGRESICFEASCENGNYLCLLPESSIPLDIETITGWSYLPYDERNFSA